MWALIRDGVVSEITNLDPSGRFHPSLVWIACTADVRPGWSFDGAAFTPPVAPAIPVPASITMRQARRCLYDRGLIDQVDAAIAALPEPERTHAQIDWERSSAVERYRGLVLLVAQGLGLTDAQLDELFIEAAQL